MKINQNIADRSVIFNAHYVLSTKEAIYSLGRKPPIIIEKSHSKLPVIQILNILSRPLWIEANYE
jgi:hypothetical protein